MLAPRGGLLPAPQTERRTIPEVADGILNAIGRTPLVRFSRYLDDPAIELFVKLEAANPGGSAKDRPARLMIEHAIASGDVNAATTVIESSSGNMGIGLAQACGYYGLPFICVVDPNAQETNLQLIQALGGRIERVTEPIDGSYLAARLKRVRELLSQIENSFWPNQYANPRNPESHFRGTIREIHEALAGDFDTLFVATSSTGTIQGCRRYLREIGNDAQVVAVDAQGSALFGGEVGPRVIPGLGAGVEPPLARGQRFDELVRVNDLDCVIGCRRAAEREATLVGGSAGGVLEAIRRMSPQLIGQRCVAILHDSGARYLQTVYDDGWVAERLGVSPETVAILVNDAVPHGIAEGEA